MRIFIIFARYKQNLKTKQYIMKKIYLFAASLITIVAVSCNSQQTPAATTTSNTAKVADSGDYSGIVYINTDSLLRGYQMYKDLSAEFQLKAEKVQKELNMKAGIFETQYKSFQNKIEKGLVTRAEAQKMEQDLQMEQQTLVKYRDEKLGELQEQEQVMTNNISENVRVYIEKYNAEKKYKMIINTSMATNVIVAADPSVDITTEVLTGLNAEYKPAVK